MKHFLLLIAAMAVMTMQAQTCKIAANKNNGKIIQISVNLDSLKGQTLITTISQKVGGNVDVQMAYEDENNAPVIVQEDSTAQAENEVTDSTVAAEEKPDTTTVSDEEKAAEGDTSDDSVAEETPAQEGSIAGSLLNFIGVGEVASLVGGLTKTNGEEYVEYYAKKLTEADTTKYQPVYKQRKWKWLKNYISYPTLEVSGIFGKDFGKDDDAAEAEEISEEDYGANPDKSLNVGGSIKFSQVFVPGRYDANGKFIPNSLNFAWSVGALFAMDHQKDYGWSWDMMAKVGIQAGNGITLGVDGLIGGGSTPYAIYSTNYIDHRVIFHNQWCFKIGAQAWVSMNYGGNTYTSLFARIVRSVAPSSVYNHPTAQGWDNLYVDFDEGSWQVGVAVGYKFGYNSNLTNRRLIATVRTGYRLTGEEKAAETIIELEKFNNVSEKLDFSYGLAYSTAYGEDELQSFMLTGGWRIKPSLQSKFAYLAKFYIGAGEYMVGKRVADKDRNFDMSDASVKQMCAKVGVLLGASYQLGCFNLNAGLYGGYHYGFDTEYEGYKITESTGLRGFDFMPTVGVGINF